MSPLSCTEIAGAIVAALAAGCGLVWLASRWVSRAIDRAYDQTTYQREAHLATPTINPEGNQ